MLTLPVSLVCVVGTHPDTERVYVGAGYRSADVLARARESNASPRLRVLRSLPPAHMSVQRFYDAHARYRSGDWVTLGPGAVEQAAEWLTEDARAYVAEHGDPFPDGEPAELLPPGIERAGDGFLLHGWHPRRGLAG